jgi:RNA polymerase sigma-70 factor (ECF subfamily)
VHGTAATIAEVFRAERARVLATTIRVVGGDFDFAEEVVQDAFADALSRWPVDGTPDEPRAWLIAVARNKAIDRIRRRVKHDQIVADLPEAEVVAGPKRGIPDDRLRLIFTCCHPALAREAQVALTLRTLGGLSTDEIARAFLVPPPTMAQRLVRAKGKIKAARIPYVVPDPDEIAERIAAVMEVVYLIFNEGYAATAGDDWIRRDLCREAIRLGRLLVEIIPDEREARGLLALMLLHDSRRDARTDASGDIVLLEDQDRRAWDAGQIAEALPLVETALRGGPGPYAVQAAIAALHARAARAEDTDWRQIGALYTAMLAHDPAPVVALNHAAAVAMAIGPEAGLALCDRLAGELDDYHLYHAARADLLRRLDRRDEAIAAYRAALGCVGSAPERRFLERRLAALLAK